MKFCDSRYLLAYVGPLLVLCGLYQGGVWSFAGLVFGFVLIPLLEFVVGEITIHSSSKRTDRAIHWGFDLMLYANLPLVYAMVGFYLWRVLETGILPWEVLGMTLSTGVFLGANGINVAHELGHRSSRFERFLAWLLLLPALYQHFYIEHNRGHHRYVATPQDPATARVGENLYAFWLRSLLGGLQNAWRLEHQRLRKLGHGLWRADNLFLVFILWQGLYLVLVYFFWGLVGVGAAIAIALVAVLLLEAINYIEHYGLLRQPLPSGGYERTMPIHSWNSNHFIGRIMLYELTRHSDHHYKASKKYQMLENMSESPQLLTGYPGSVLLALLPGLWFKLMNGRIPTHMLSRLPDR